MWSSKTVKTPMRTVWPSSSSVPAAVSTALTGPASSLSTRMRLALALRPAASLRIASLSMATRMPSFSSPRPRVASSSSRTLAALSSKRTPLTMIEPKPVIVPSA